MFRHAGSIAKTAVLMFAGVASAFVTIQTAAAAEIVTVCRAHSGDATATSGHGDFQLSRLLSLSAASIEPAGNDFIALARDENGFDVIVGWHQEDEHSLRAAGADILGMDLGSLIHLMVADSQKHVEHYLFSLDEDGSGDLLWNGEASGRENEASSSFACTKPR